MGSRARVLTSFICWLLTISWFPCILVPSRSAGEMYVVVIGHEYNQLTPASLLRMGEAILATAKQFNLGAEPSLQYPLPVTAGICTGPAYASVVGTRIPRYIFFGEAVIGATALQVRPMHGTCIVVWLISSCLFKLCLSCILCLTGAATP
jgi:hypothetical protein